ncbi:M24 family metallopeptidase, partial [Chloroflexota bacterium]
GVKFSRPGMSLMMEGSVRATDDKLRTGDSITFDFGACYRGYCSDFGRTAYLGEPPEELLKTYDILIKAQTAAIEAMVSGTVTAKQLDRVARDIIEDAGYGRGFTHRLGHGIGVTVHEPPFLYEPDDTLLTSNMAMTIEPSIIVPDSHGCRIEDVVVVTENGGLSLNNFHKEIVAI